MVIVQKNLQSKYKTKHNRWVQKRCKEKNKIKGVVGALRYTCKQQIKWCLGLTVNESLEEGVEKYQSCFISNPTKSCGAFLSLVALASLAVGLTIASSPGIQQNNF